MCKICKKAPLRGEAWMPLAIFMPFLQTWGHPEFVTVSPPPWGNIPCHRCSKAQSDLSWHLYLLLLLHKHLKNIPQTHSYTCHPPITFKGENSGSTEGVFSIFLHFFEGLCVSVEKILDAVQPKRSYYCSKPLLVTWDWSTVKQGITFSVFLLQYCKPQVPKYTH